MPIASKGVFIIGAKRTPFCQYGGPLRELPASHVFAATAKDAIQSARLDPTIIDQTIVGNVNYLSQCDGGKTPRYCGIYSGVPIEKAALGVSKACGTGLQAVVSGAVDILFGTSKVILTGGTDVMSTLPMLVRHARFGTALGTPYAFEDHIQRNMVDSYSGLTLIRIADDLAKKYGVARKDVDEFAMRSHFKWKAADRSNDLAEEITSMTVNIKNKEILVVKDQLTQPNLHLEQLNQLPSLLEDGVVTSGNYSVPADGAAALILASEDAVKHHKLSPLTRIAGWSCVGVDPTDTGLAAAEAVKKLLDEQRVRAEDVDLFEINETFASEVLVTVKELQINLDKVNVNGGALAIGHPVSATGARMVTSLIYALRSCNGRRAVVATSCGGGQGVALMMETL